MANAGVCSTKLTIDGVKIPLGRYVVYTYVGGEVKRIRHASQLPHDRTYHQVVAIPKTAPAPSLRAIDNTLDGLTYSFYGRGRHIELPDGTVAGWTEDSRRYRRRMTEGRIRTAEGGWGFIAPPIQELRMLASSDRSTGTFYETAEQRSERRRKLVAALSAADPKSLAVELETLRNGNKQRTAAVMIAVDAVMAGHLNGRQLLGIALQRPDEPGLALRYFNDTYGHDRRLPQALRKGLADAAVRLYTEQATLRFDRNRYRAVDDRNRRGTPVRFKDVIAVAHPTPGSPQQSALFKALLTGVYDPEHTPLLHIRHQLTTADPLTRESMLQDAATEAREALRAGRLPSHPLARMSVADIASLVGQGSQQRREAIEALRATDGRSRQICNSEEFADIRRAVRAAERRVRDAAPGSDRDKAVEVLTELRATPEFRKMHDQLTEARTAANRARIAVREAAAQPGVIHPAVWEVAAPRMSLSETLTNLAAMERSTVSPELRALVEDKISNRDLWSSGSTQLPDLLRAVRGATLGTPVRSGKKANDLNMSADTWLTRAPSSWEPALGAVAEQIISERLGDVPGKVLVLVDGSGSMDDEVSGRANDHRAEGYQSLRRAEVASFAAAAIARSCADVDVYAYDHKALRVDFGDGDRPIFETTRAVAGRCEWGGTDTLGALRDTWDGHDLVVILTDEQTTITLDQNTYVDASQDYGYMSPRERLWETIPSTTRFVTVNLAGYQAAHAEDSDRFVRIAGWSESLFDEVRRQAQAVAADKAGHDTSTSPDPEAL